MAGKATLRDRDTLVGGHHQTEMSLMAGHAKRWRLLPYRPVTLAELEQTASQSPAALPYLLAVKFNYDVNQGGFAQLFFNLQGHFLSDVEDMLCASGATVAHEYYVRALRLALADTPEYFRFLESNYLEDNSVKHALQMLSGEYFQLTEFETEAVAFLTSCPRV